MHFVSSVLSKLGWRRRDPGVEAAAAFEQHVVGRTNLVRDGIAFQFIELESGMFYVNAARRTKPYLQATFMTECKEVGEAWRDFGQVPSGETHQLFEQFQLGTWPTTIPGSG